MLVVGLSSFVFTFPLPVEMWFKIKVPCENIARNILKVILCLKDFVP